MERPHSVTRTQASCRKRVDGRAEQAQGFSLLGLGKSVGVHDGRSTLRQVWPAFASPEAGNSFERNSRNGRVKGALGSTLIANATRRQLSRRGWVVNGNEVTCHLSGYGKRASLRTIGSTFLGRTTTSGCSVTMACGATITQKPGEPRHPEGGKRLLEEKASSSGNTSGQVPFLTRRPDIFVNQMALHVCFRLQPAVPHHQRFVQYHESTLPTVMGAIRDAIERPLPDGTPIRKTSRRR